MHVTLHERTWDSYEHSKEPADCKESGQILSMFGATYRRPTDRPTPQLFRPLLQSTSQYFHLVVYSSVLMDDGNDKLRYLQALWIGS